MSRKSIEQRRALEDAAMVLGEERAQLKQRLDENTGRVIKLLRVAIDHVPLEQFARLTGISRASLYRWMDQDETTTEQPRTENHV